jgi:hypothetical protein
LRLGGEQGSLCVPGPAASQDWTYGYDAVGNSTGETITIDRVVLVGAKNVTLQGGYLTPIVDRTLIGVRQGWADPATGAPSGTGSALPTRLSPGETANLVIHLTATAPADLQAVEVTYEHRGRKFRVRNSTALQVRAACF